MSARFPVTSRLARIEAAVQRTNDKRQLRLLYRAWNAEALSLVEAPVRCAAPEDSTSGKIGDWC